MEWNQSGIGMEMEMEWIFTTKEVDDGIEMEWKWNLKGMEILLQKRSIQNGMEME